MRHIERTRLFIHIVDAAQTESRDAVDDVYKINDELKNYSKELCDRPQIIAANKADLIFEDGEENPIDRLKKEFEPKGIPVYPISAATGKGIRELIYRVQNELDKLPKEKTVFEQEFFPEEMAVVDELPYTVFYDKDENEYRVEGPKVDKMLGYTNLESEKGFAFFQNFLKDSGILQSLEDEGIQEGDTVRIYGFLFDYHK